MEWDVKVDLTSSSGPRLLQRRISERDVACNADFRLPMDYHGQMQVCPRHSEHHLCCDDCLRVRKYVDSLKTSENWRKMDEIGSRHEGRSLPPWRIDRFGTPIIPKERNGKSG